MTPKQLAFVREFAIDRNAKQAAIRAGYSERTAEQQGYQLLQNPSVSEAIEAMEVEHRTQCAVTVERLTRELYEARDLAQSNSQPAAMVSALMGIAKLHGLIIDRQKVDTTHRTVREMTDEELLEIAHSGPMH
jgi:phage terminase small subunit